MASKAAARHHMIRHLPMTRRTVTVAVSAVVAVAVMAGFGTLGYSLALQFVASELC